MNAGQKPAKGVIGGGTPMTIGFVTVIVGGMFTAAVMIGMAKSELQQLAAGYDRISTRLDSIDQRMHGFDLRLAAMEQRIENSSPAAPRISPK